MKSKAQKQLEGYPVIYATCRALTGHHWGVVNVTVPTRSNAITYHYACNLCTMYKKVMYNKRTGHTISTSYTQPTGYRIKDAPSRDVIRRNLFSSPGNTQ